MSDTTEKPPEAVAKPESKPIPDNAPKPYPGEVIMWRDEAVKSRRKGLKSMRCRILWIGNHSGHKWWESPYGLGGGAERDSSPHCLVQWAIGVCNEQNLIYVVMHEEEFKRDAPPARRCQIQSMVTPKTMTMLQSAPNNDVFRAALMSEVGEAPPKEADTFMKLRDWVEYTFPKELPQMKNPVKPLEAVCNYTENESGRCYYDRINRWNGTIQVSVAELIKIAEDSNHDTALRRNLADHIIALIEETQECAHGESNIYDCEVNQTNNRRATYSTDVVNDAYDILSKVAKPEVLARFGIRPHSDNPHNRRGPAPVPVRVPTVNPVFALGPEDTAL